jgi:hypothetical protein
VVTPDLSKFYAVTKEKKYLIRSKKGRMELNDIIANLKSENPDTVIQGIEELKENGSAAHFPVLMNLLHETTNNEVKKNILTLFSELKSTDTVPLLMSSIQNKLYQSELKELISCCWQNGLNYRSYLPVFVDLVIKEEFPVAFEALTVVENMYGKIDPEIIKRELDKINQVTVIDDDQKNFLLSSLSYAISNIPETNQEHS